MFNKKMDTLLNEFLLIAKKEHCTKFSILKQIEAHIIMHYDKIPEPKPEVELLKEPITGVIGTCDCVGVTYRTC